MLQRIANEMNEAYGLLGSIFRHGSRLTTFSSQAMQFADLYSYSCYNLIYYPLCYMFRAPPMLMPHESTVPHEESAFESFKDLEDSPCGLRRRTTTEAVVLSGGGEMVLKPGQCSVPGGKLISGKKRLKVRNILS
ncbi:unnamed protein product [Hydatigera taeniaeformis]|uniref:Uncharacterized protein n=1 Tax=Hydatigena taeniaeformis TaxID=6205 RepID=A0A0R3WS12_HYDTA|nr:unnamed protein product [Hydatigera taeniaeformis]